MRVKYVPLLIILFLVPLAFDYKTTDDNQSHVLQYALLVPVLLAGVLLALIGPRFNRRSQTRSIAIAAVVVTVAGSIVTQLIQGNDVAQYMRVILTFILFLLGFFVGCHPWSEERSGMFDRWLFYGMTMSVIASLLGGLASGEAIENVRYHIISPVFLGFQGLLLFQMVIRRRRSLLTSILFIGTLAIEILSVTRSLLVGTCLLFCFAAWLAAPTAKHLIKSGLRTFAVATALAAVIGGSAAWLFPSVIDHWSQRIFYAESVGGGKDPTTLSRLAELQDQYDQVTSDITSILIGKGYGHNFHYAETYILELIKFQSRSDLESVNAWQAGHNFWVYQFFAGGILFGIALPAALLYTLYRCSLAYRRAQRVALDSQHLQSTGKYLMVVAGMLVTTIGGNPLGPRYSGLVYGLALGLLIAAHSRMLVSRRTTAQVAAFQLPLASRSRG